ncbi:hypothetical protein MKX01_003812 [Papaver californicum]|nr:hypothetical protein MKX01_003812 [Papaver californicum]
MMWSSRGDDHGNRVSSSSSKSPSSSHSSILRNPRRKTMEEVWNNINLTCIHHKNNNNTSSSIGGVEDLSPLPKPKTTSQTFPVISNLQEFLARPFNKDTQSTLISRFSTTQVHPPPPPPPVLPQPAAPVAQPLPPTINLNSACDQQFPYMDDNNDEHPLRPNPRLNQHNSFIDSPSFVSALNTSHPFDQAFGNSTLPNNKRRASDETDDNNNINCTGDRRHKRMIKNRESAARSRARKQESLSLSPSHFFHLID